MSNVADLVGSEMRSQSACSSPQSASSGGVGSVIMIHEDTLNVCRMTQSMIDIAAKQLFGLRRGRTSEELIQKEICECEVGLIVCHKFTCIQGCCSGSYESLHACPCIPTKVYVYVYGKFI
jgi:hypothetical protein